MYCIGIDVGSTYTKYCVMSEGNIINVFSEKTPVRQRDYFDKKLIILHESYPEAIITSCGYGKNNIDGIKKINELTALARGSYYILKKDCAVLDIGGQDTKFITQKEGSLKEFFLNDKCAAGSGMFLTYALEMLGLSFYDLDLEKVRDTPTLLNSTCAVFAQSEIVQMIADNISEASIIYAVIWQIFVKAKSLLNKSKVEEIVLSGGISKVKGINGFAEKVLGITCSTVENGDYLAAIGCCVL